MQRSPQVVEESPAPEEPEAPRRGPGRPRKVTLTPEQVAEQQAELAAARAPQARAMEAPRSAAYGSHPGKCVEDEPGYRDPGPERKVTAEWHRNSYGRATPVYTIEE